MKPEYDRYFESYRSKLLAEYYVRVHGRIISGYCPCCGKIVEITGKCPHDPECIYSEERVGPE